MCVLWNINLVVTMDRSVKKAEEKAEESRNLSSARVVVPGTPRHMGIGAGTRITAAPRRRGGI